MLKNQLIIIRDFEQMMVWSVLPNTTNEKAWDYWNEKFPLFDFDVLEFDTMNDLNEFLMGELPKM